MALIFIAIDPETDTEHCPAVFVEEETGDLLFQGGTVQMRGPWQMWDGARLQTMSRWSGCPLGCGRSSWRRLMAKVPPFSELIAATVSSAMHLEMRDAYTPSDPQFLGGGRVPRGRAGEPGLVRPGARPHGARSKFRRARIMSEPVSDYIRFEHEATAGLNVAAGEEVRWLPRRYTSGLCLPGNDFWLFDNQLVRSTTSPATARSSRTRWSPTQR